MIRRLASYLPAVLVLFALFVFGGDSTPQTTRAAGTKVVTVADDTSFDGVCDSHCTLREAMTRANDDADVDTIEFAITPFGGVKDIILTENLPEITTPMRIDGRTQSGANCSTHSLTISIVGGGTATQGFRVNHAGNNGSLIAGLNIRGINGPGIVLAAGHIHGVRCSNIGTTADGTAASPNTGDGIVIEAGTAGPSGILIGANALAGDPDDEERNIISGNLGAGIRSNSPGTPVRVSGNYIGTNAAGTAAIGNGDSGVVGSGMEIGISSAGGGSGIGAGNLISGNTGAGNAGIEISGTDNAIIRGNIIGLNAAGTSAIPNANGIITSSEMTFIGEDGVTRRNVISGNTGAGIVFLAGSSGSTAANNYIGTNAAGTAAIPNGVGVSIQAATSITIGNSGANVISGNTGNAIDVGPGTSNTTIAGNLIGYAADGTITLANGGNGIEVTSSDNLGTEIISIGGGGTSDNRFYVRRSSGSDPLRNAILAIQEPGNEPIREINIFGNSIDSDGLGIDLRLSTDAINTVTENDEDDADTDGPNQFTNFPVITSADASAPSISGTFNGVPGELHTLHFYKSDSCNSATRRIGQVYLGSLLIGTDVNGDTTFTKLSFDAVFEEGDWITATAAGWDEALHGTSEFSDCFEATGAPGLQITQLVPASMPAGSLEFELKAQGSGFQVGDQIRWNGTLLATNYTSSNELRANISPATIGATKGVATIDVVSTNPAATSNEKQFTIARSSSDVNCDGSATSADALQVLEELAGLSTNGTSCLSNANQTGATDIADVNWIRREVAGFVQPLASFTP